jgi:YD repeat-containing protein
MTAEREIQKAKLLGTLHRLLLVLFVGVAIVSSTHAQQGGTTTYIYDDNGRLHVVISPTGEAAVYEYDAAGNITSIRRLAAGTLAIFSFAPHEGVPGDQVTIVGSGFGAGVSNVSFNGASATIVSVSGSRIVATVPAGATTGPITVTTPQGSVSTTTPFTIAGLRVSPSAAIVRFGESVQFTAEVLPSTIDQSVIWSVNGSIGGNAGVGTISTAGVYTAPNTAFSSLTIRATSVADNTRFAEALVKVTDPNDIQTVFAAPLTVQRGDTAPVTAAAAPLTVQYDKVAELQTAMSAGVTVQRAPLDKVTAMSPSITVQRGDTAKVGGLSQPVTVLYQGSATFTAQTAVSATAGPYIQSLTPASLARGTSTSVTITGVGLTGATTLRFINAATGANDTTITVSNLVVSPDGTSLTATLTVSGSAALGARIVVVATPNGDSIRVDVTSNRINITP